MFCSEPRVRIQTPLIVKPLHQIPVIDLNHVLNARCHLHGAEGCQEIGCSSIIAYQSFLGAAKSSLKAQQFNLVRLDVVAEDRAELADCLALICVAYSSAEASLKVNVVGLDQPGISHCFIYNTEQFDQLKQKHGLNVNMSEFVSYLAGILQATQALTPESVWYSLKLVTEQNCIKLLITENRTRRFLLFLSLESSELHRLPSLLAHECLSRWNFSISLLASCNQLQERFASKQASFDRSMERKDADLAAMTAELANVKKDLSASLDSLDALKELRTTESEKLKKLEEAVAGLEADRTRVAERLQREEMRTDELTSSKESLSNELVRARREVEQLRAQLEENEARHARSKELDAQLAQAKTQVDRLMNENEKLFTEHSSLTAKVTTITTELVELRREHLELTVSHQTLASERAKLLSEKSSLEDAYAAARVQASQKESLAAERDKLEETCAQLESKLRSVNLHVAKRVLGQISSVGSTGSERPLSRQGWPENRALPTYSPRLESENNYGGENERPGMMTDEGAFSAYEFAQPLSSASLLERNARLNKARRETPPLRQSRHSTQYTR